MSLYTQLFYSDTVNALFSDSETIAQMIRVEVYLAQAQANKGLFSESIVKTIKEMTTVTTIDIEKLKQDILLGGNAAIPLVKQLTQIVKNKDPEAAKFIHLGATSQDIVDTAMVLQIKDYINWLELKIILLETQLIRLTQKHRETITIGRTLLQQAKPTTFGFKTAGWLEAISRSKQRVQEIKQRVLVLQLGGAVGNGNANITIEIQEELARLLSLKPSFSWHSHRDNLAEMAGVLGVLSGTLGKIAKDISLLMQTEVGEVFEGAADGKGGSSSMPHKRNPVLTENLTGLARMVRSYALPAMENVALWHERDISHSSVERYIGPDACITLDFALARMTGVIDKLLVYPERMQKNLDRMGGLVHSQRVLLALTQAGLERDASYRLVQRNAMKVWESDGQLSLLELLKADPEVAAALTPEQLNVMGAYLEANK